MVSVDGGKVVVGCLRPRSMNEAVHFENRHQGAEHDDEDHAAHGENQGGFEQRGKRRHLAPEFAGLVGGWLRHWR